MSSEKQNTSDSSVISMCDFFDFLKITCQVNELIADSNLITATTKTGEKSSEKLIDYNQLAKNELINNLITKSKQQLNTGNGQTDRNETATSTASSGLFGGSIANSTGTGSVVISSSGVVSSSGAVTNGGPVSSSGVTAGTSNSLEKKDKTQPIKKQRSSHKKSKDNIEPNWSVVPILQDKLEEVINEGILDSVLPFIYPNTMSSLSSSINPVHNCPTSSVKHMKQPISILPISSPPTTITSSTSATQFTSNSPKISSTNQLYGSVSSSQLNKEKINNKLSTSSGNNGGTGNNLLPDSFTKKFDNFEKSLMPRTISKETNPSSRRKSSIQSSSNSSLTETEVTIHVCDELKNASKDFTCPQKLLITKMGYFADVTAGQRLTDMDISVHCDLQIFEWLMRWVKKESMNESMWPVLDPTNIVPILVSSSFLQMEPLLLDCLSFCHSHLNEIVKVSTNLSCLNDNILSRLAAMFTNMELEMVKDKKERITPRLWTKLITSLCEIEPQALRGHYASLADLFKCNRCNKYLTKSVSTRIDCIPQNMTLNRWGQLISQHVRDSQWNLTNYVAHLYKELKSWRKVYWRLWGNCHFLYCTTCEVHFPTYQMNWCAYHPEQPHFLGPVTEGRMTGPTGRYPCCGQQAFRYELLPGQTGCQYREHTVQIETDRDRGILNLVQIAIEGDCLTEPPPLQKSHNRLTTLTKSNNNSNTSNGAAAAASTTCSNESTNNGAGAATATGGTGFSNIDVWWNGIILTPQRERQGLLPNLNIDVGIKKSNLSNKPSMLLDSSSETESSDNGRNASCSTFKQFSTSSDGCESDDDYSSPRPVKKKRHKCSKRKVKPTGRFWSDEISARSNQDNQREYEEKAMQQVIAMIEKKFNTNLSQTQYQNNPPVGGTYVQLEAEWREQLKHKNTGGVRFKCNK